MQECNTPIKGLMVFKPKIFKDSRGYFYEAYNEKLIENLLGFKKKFVQDNFSFSKKGVLRGIHYQKKPYEQAKLVSVLSGSVFDVAVDLRPKSKTYLQWYGILLSSRNKKTFYIPEGFGHGFLVLSQNAKFMYKTSNFYSKADEECIIWNDKKINIDWPLKKYNIKKPIISTKDLLCKKL